MANTETLRRVAKTDAPAAPVATPVAAPVAAPAVSPPKKSIVRTVIFLTLAAAALGGGAYWYLSRIGKESTDDAQIDADVVSVPARTSGIVERVSFGENQTVKKGQVLVELDGRPARAKLAEAEASLEAANAAAAAADEDARVAETNAKGNKSAAQASLSGAANSASATNQQIAEAEAGVVSAQASFDKAKLDLDRAQSLLASGAIAQASVDQARSSFDTAAATLTQSKAHLASIKSSTAQAWSRVQEASARLEQARDVNVVIKQADARARSAHAQAATAQAALELAKLEVEYTQVRAPEDGVVSKKSVTVGQMVSPGQAVVQLVPVTAEWITANFKETQLEKMRPGQPVEIDVDAYPHARIKGEVESFSAATGARFALLPPDNATGNFTKVVQRVPVRIKLVEIPEGLFLRPGMSANITVLTGK